MPPPIREISLILDFSSGCASSRAATLVSGPVGTSVTGSALSESTLAISSTALISSGSKAGSGRSGPSSPDLPCTVGAMIGSETSGPVRPRAIGARSPMRVMMRSAL